MIIIVVVYGRVSGRRRLISIVGINIVIRGDRDV